MRHLLLHTTRVNIFSLFLAVAVGETSSSSVGDASEVRSCGSSCSSTSGSQGTTLLQVQSHRQRRDYVDEHHSADEVVKSECVTREDPRAYSWTYATSPAGTPCIFGLDPSDEGFHCIESGG